MLLAVVLRVAVRAGVLEVVRVLTGGTIGVVLNTVVVLGARLLTVVLHAKECAIVLGRIAAC